VNRYWKHFFNRGIVEPEDDNARNESAVEPRTARRASRSISSISGYDLKTLIRDMTRVRQTYQLSAGAESLQRRPTGKTSRVYFAKRLTAEVLFDSINTVTPHAGQLSRHACGHPGNLAAGQ